MEIKATKPVMPLFEDYVNEIRSIWDTGILTNNGEKVQRFSEKLKTYLDCENIDLFVNGHSALYLAIKVMDLEGEVITSPFTFVSTTNAIVQNGLTPVFGDIDENYNLDPNSIEDLITEKTSAIITPHIFGIPCDVKSIEEIAKKYNLKVIYDAAQAFGTKINGKSIAHYGDATMFSFHAIKVFNSIEGGAVVYRNSKLKEKFELYRNFGISYGETNDVLVSGINAKMNEFQAAMGILNLSSLEQEIAKRKKIAQQYINTLKHVEGIETYSYKNNIEYNYAYFPIIVTQKYGRSRDELWKHLKDVGIGSRKLYDLLTCDYSLYQNCGYVNHIEKANYIKKICLDMPMYAGLTYKEIQYICDEIKMYRK
ncbi:MAG: DegT/DnrJ/EryC1/StrS family aminotransferase [Lachnospiraceae bacterium]|nr:DegT/DnrJ/EryC1/StrS family aminotransferase [Lachnospiraceae bacterium]